MSEPKTKPAWILLAAFVALLAGGVAIAVVVSLAGDVF